MIRQRFWLSSPLVKLALMFLACVGAVHALPSGQYPLFREAKYRSFICRWTASRERWDRAQGKWLYDFKLAWDVSNPDGLRWQEPMLLVDTVYGLVDTTVERTIGFEPGHTVMIREGGWDAGAGGFIHNGSVPRTFVVPPAPWLDPDCTRASDLKIGGPCDRGMAVAGAHVMLCSLSITDTPLNYAPPFGPSIDFTLTYNQREESRHPTGFFYSHVGRKWQYSWLSYVDEVKEVDAPIIMGFLSTLTPTVALPGGGVERYGASLPFGSSAPVPASLAFASLVDNRATLARVSDTLYERREPDGAKLVFGHLWGGRFFLTEIVDRQGNRLVLGYDAAHRVSTITDAAGGITTFSYEHSDNFLITRVTDPFGRYCTLAYDASGRLKTITDTVGMSSGFTYEADDFISALTTPYGTSRFAYGDGAGTRWLTLTDPNNAVEKLQYYDNITTLPNLGAMPSASGLLTSPADDQKRYTLYWNKKAMAERPNETAAAHLFHWMLGKTYGPSGSLQDEKRSLENRVFYNYYGQTEANIEGTSRRPTIIARSLDDGTSQVLRRTYDMYGNTTKIVDPVGRQTSFIYDSNGIDLTEMRQNTGPSDNDYAVLSQFTYNAQHLPLTVTDASRQVTSLTYNSAGQVRTITNPRSETTTFWYHSTGQAATLPLDDTATGYLVQVDGPLSGATGTMRYDAAGLPRSVTDSSGYTVITAYDDFGRPTRTTYPDGTYEEVTYDRLDVAKVRDRRGRMTTMKYNSVRQLEKVVDPLQRVTQYEWCKCGALEALIDPLGQTTRWLYDIQFRPTDKFFADGTRMTYSYENSTSRVRAITDAKRQVAAYTYFADDALKQVSYANASVATPTVDFTYDLYYSRLATMVDGNGTTSYAYNPIPVSDPQPGAGRLASIDGPLANDTISYTYDQLGRVSTRSINGSANAASFVYDALGRTSSVTNPLGPFTFGYMGTTGRLDHMIYPNGQRTNYSYYPMVGTVLGNGDQRLQQIENLKAGGVNVSTFEYTYDAAGVIQTWSRKVDAASALTSAFKYDRADQLTEAAIPSTSSQVRNYVYRYSRAGNRLSEQIDGGVTSAQHNVVNQVVALSPSGPIRFEGTVSEPSNVTVHGQTASVDATNNFTADVRLSPGTSTVAITATDGSGNVATRNYQVAVDSGTARALSYDGNGNLVNDGAGRTYGWDAANRLVQVTQGTAVTEFVYDGLGRRVKEKLNGAVVKQWVWCEGPQPAEERDGSNAVTKRFFGGLGQQIAGASYYFTADHLGSVREMVDASGVVRARYEYDPYGRSTKVLGDLDADFGFTGFHRHQGTGLSLTLYRAYDPVLGRWLSRDTIGENGGINLYGYISNRPINGIDPLGLFVAPPVVGPAPPPVIAGVLVFQIGYGVGTIIDTTLGVSDKIASWYGPKPEDFHAPRVQGAMPPPRPPKPPRGGAAAACPNSPNGENEHTASGREAHKWWQPPEGYRTDFEFDNGLKPDAINFQTRNILELKPNNPQAIQQGMRQIQKYIKAAQEQFGGTWTGQVVTR